MNSIQANYVLLITAKCIDKLIEKSMFNEGKSPELDDITIVRSIKYFFQTNTSLNIKDVLPKTKNYFLN